MPPIKYWIVKGNKNYPNDLDERDGDLDRMVQDSETEPVSRWLSKKKLPDDCQAGGRVFFWSSSPDCHIRAIGEIVHMGRYRPGRHVFDVRFIDELPKDGRIGIKAIREAYEEKLNYSTMPHFLRPAIVATVYQLEQQEAAILSELIGQQPENRQRSKLMDTLGQWFPSPP